MRDKLNNFIHSKLFVIVLIFVFIIITSIVGTYAWFTWSNPSGQNTIFTISIGEILDVTFSDGNTINSNLNPVYNYSDGLSTSFTANNKIEKPISYEVFLNIDSIDSELTNSNNVKYIVFLNDEVVSEGNLKGVSNGDSVNLSFGTLPSGMSNFDIYFYIDGNVYNDSNMMNKSISGNIMVEAEISKYAVDYITNLYINDFKTIVTASNIEYNYATTVNLMNDRLGGTTSDYDAGNIIYYGTDPNNYVDIGDRTSDNEVILYRIIGLFKDVELADGTKKDLIKVIRDDTIGDYSWDTKPNGIGSSTSVHGSSNWTDATLMMLLNPGYENGAIDVNGNIIYEYEGSLWWNSKSGECYNEVGFCDFTSSGLSSNVQNKIETVVWDIEVYPDNQTEWIGKVALLNVFESTYTRDLDNDGRGSWMSAWVVKNYYQWQLDPADVDMASQICIPNSMTMACLWMYANSHKAVRPVFYLKSELSIGYGDGTKDNPYVIG